MRPLLLTLALALPLPLLAAYAPLPIMAVSTTGQRNPGFLIAAEPDGLVISNAPQGGNSVKVLFTNIAELNVEEPKGWSAALARLNAGNYADAETAFSTYADDCAPLVPWKDGYGSLARLYHFKALKGLGKFAELATAMDRQLAKPLVLGDLSKIDFNDLRGWAILAKADLQALQSYLNEFIDTAASKQWSLQPPFKKDLPGRLIASLAFLRGHLHEKQQRVELALLDYSSAMTCNNGSDHTVFSMACLASLKITAAQSAAKPSDEALRKAATSLALTYRDISAKGKLPKEFAALATLPEPPPAAAPAKK
jgi:hypothetical protein